MAAVEVDVTVGGTVPLTVPSTSATADAFQGAGTLLGWSLRDAVADVAQQAEGSVVAPGAGAIIVTLSGLAAGTYTVHWDVELQGAAAAGDANNFQLFNGVTPLEVSVNPGAAGTYPQADTVLVVPASGSVSIKSVGAGTAGVTYAAQLSLVPNGIIETVVEIVSGQDILGEVSLTDQSSDTRWFGPMGPPIRQKVTLVVVSGIVRGVLYVIPSSGS